LPSYTTTKYEFTARTKLLVNCTLSFARRLAPALTKHLTTSKYPSFAAHIRGVEPSYRAKEFEYNDVYEE